MNGKVAYITGGSKGIGLGIAKSLVQNGVNVAISGRDVNALETAQKELEQLRKGSSLIIVSDVRNFKDEKNAVDQVIKSWGKLDILIANAGVGRFDSIENLSIDDWNDTIQTNLTGAFHSIKSAVEALKNTQGYIFTIASLAGTNFFKNGSAYNASKFGLVGFTQAVMLDLRKYKIKTTTIMPGSVSTFFNDNIPSDEDSWKIQPEDIGQLVVDLLKMHPRTLPSKIELRPTLPPSYK